MSDNQLLIDIAAASALLGAMAPYSIRKLCKSGQLRHIKNGRRLLFRRDWIEAYLEDAASANVAAAVALAELPADAYDTFVNQVAGAKCNQWGIYEIPL